MLGLVGLVEDCVGISDANVTAVQSDHSLAARFDSALETIVLVLCRALIRLPFLTTIDSQCLIANTRHVLMVMHKGLQTG